MISFSWQKGLLMLEVADLQHIHTQIPATPQETLGIEHPKESEGVGPQREMKLYRLHPFQAA